MHTRFFSKCWSTVKDKATAAYNYSVPTIKKTIDYIFFPARVVGAASQGLVTMLAVMSYLQQQEEDNYSSTNMLVASLNFLLSLIVTYVKSADLMTGKYSVPSQQYDFTWKEQMLRGTVAGLCFYSLWCSATASYLGGMTGGQMLVKLTHPDLKKHEELLAYINNNTYWKVGAESVSIYFAIGSAIYFFRWPLAKARQYFDQWLRPPVDSKQASLGQTVGAAGLTAPNLIGQSFLGFFLARRSQAKFFNVSISAPSIKALSAVSVLSFFVTNGINSFNGTREFFVDMASNTSPASINPHAKCPYYRDLALGTLDSIATGLSIFVAVSSQLGDIFSINKYGPVMSAGVAFATLGAANYFFFNIYRNIREIHTHRQNSLYNVGTQLSTLAKPFLSNVEIQEINSPESDANQLGYIPPGPTGLQDATPESLVTSVIKHADNTDEGFNYHSTHTLFAVRTHRNWTIDNIIREEHFNAGAPPDRRVFGFDGIRG
jgi:hypothetical protein